MGSSHFFFLLLLHVSSPWLYIDVPKSRETMCNCRSEIFCKVILVNARIVDLAEKSYEKLDLEENNETLSVYFDEILSEPGAGISGTLVEEDGSPFSVEPCPMHTDNDRQFHRLIRQHIMRGSMEAVTDVEKRDCCKESPECEKVDVNLDLFRQQARTSVWLEMHPDPVMIFDTESPDYLYVFKKLEKIGKKTIVKNLLSPDGLKLTLTSVSEGEALATVTNRENEELFQIRKCDNKHFFIASQPLTGARRGAFSDRSSGRFPGRSPTRERPEHGRGRGSRPGSGHGQGSGRDPQRGSGRQPEPQSGRQPEPQRGSGRPTSQSGRQPEPQRGRHPVQSVDLPPRQSTATGDVPFIGSMSTRAAVQCFYNETKYCLPDPNLCLTPPIIITGTDSDTQAWCSTECQDAEGCTFFTWRKNRGQIECNLLTDCIEEQDDGCLTGTPQTCLSGPKDCGPLPSPLDCAPLVKWGPQYAEWQCTDHHGEDVEAYDTLFIPYGTRCIQSCDSWVAMGSTLRSPITAHLISYCEKGGNWSKTEAYDGQGNLLFPMATWNSFHNPESPYPVPNDPMEIAMKCECETFEMRWPINLQVLNNPNGTYYDPNTEDQVEFLCEYAIDRSNREFKIYSHNTCTFLCDHQLQATVRCYNGYWTGLISKGFWCQNEPGTENGPQFANEWYLDD